MAGPNDIRDALMAAAAGGGPPDDGPDGGGDLTCPTCGASCKKIEAAAAGGPAPAPKGPAGLLG